MTVEYGITTSNKFGFMSDEEDFDDPRELIQKVSSIAAKKKDEKPAVKPAQPAKEAAATVVKSETTRGRGGRGRGRGGAGRPRDGNDGDRFGENRRGGPRRGGERGAGRPSRGRGGHSQNAVSDESKENSFEDNGEVGRPRRGRGGFSLGGPAGGRGGGRGRGRQFDRQSGSDRTGVRAFEKKDGHGKGNWGDQKDELIGETENVSPVEDAEPEAPREKTAEELAREAEEAELAKQKTLKEFKAQQAANAPKFNIRKAGEGAGDNFGKLVPMKKEVIPDREEDEVVIIRKEPRKQVLDIDIKFADNSRGGFRSDRGSDRPQRGGRGGRGASGSGGRGGRGGNRSHAPNFDASSEAFPALGSK